MRRRIEWRFLQGRLAWLLASLLLLEGRGGLSQEPLRGPAPAVTGGITSESPSRGPATSLQGPPWGLESPGYGTDYGRMAAENYPAWGQPLVGTSWLNRPWHVGWLFGGLVGDELIRGRVDQESDLIGGYRLGNDFDHFWGTELRWAYSEIDIQDEAGRRELLTARHDYWDVSLVYYPWGDARWRPFASVGMGAARFQFEDEQQQSHNAVLFHAPFGGGVKYYFRPWLGLRLSVIDHFALRGSGLETMHNMSYTADVEVHWGRKPVSYFPSNPSVTPW